MAVAWKEGPSSVTASAAPPSPPRGEGFGLGTRQRRTTLPPRDNLGGSFPKSSLRDAFGLCVGAHIVRPPVSHRPPLFCQDRRDPLVGYARQFNTPAAAAQTGGLGVVHHPRRTRAPCPRARVSHIGGPEESGLRDSGGTHVEPWSRRGRHPAALCLLCRRGQSRPPRRAESPRQIL